MSRRKSNGAADLNQPLFIWIFLCISRRKGLRVSLETGPDSFMAERAEPLYVFRLVLPDNGRQRRDM